MFEICKYSVWISYLNLLWSANPVTLWIDFISSSNSWNHFENNIPHFKNILQFPPTFIFSICIVDNAQSCTECKMDQTSESWPGASLRVITQLPYLTTVHLLDLWLGDKCSETRNTAEILISLNIPGIYIIHVMKFSAPSISHNVCLSVWHKFVSA